MREPRDCHGLRPRNDTINFDDNFRQLYPIIIIIKKQVILKKILKYVIK